MQIRTTGFSYLTFVAVRCSFCRLEELPVEPVLIRPRFLIAGASLLLGLTACDLWLAVHSLRQRATIQQLVGNPIEGAKDGDQLPVLSGTKLGTQKQWSVLPASSSALAVLVFRESCHYCDANWKNWDQVFARSGSVIPVVFVTEDKSLSATYLAEHPLLSRATVLLGVPEHIGSVQTSVTPQTIIVSPRGKVDHDWVGVLAATDLTAIKEAIPKPYY
jgi:hypothetical protein